jgi:autotransporter translocation and assembly factor TamB
LIPLIHASARPPSSERGRRAGKTRRGRFVRWLGLGLGWLVLGVILLLGLSLVSINLPPVSRFVSTKVNAILKPAFAGQLLLRKLGHVDFGGVSGAEVEVRDPAGSSVLVAQDVEVRLFWPAIALHALTGSDPLEIPVERVAVRQLDLTLIDDGTGSPTLAHAFDPKEVKPPDPNAAGTSVRVAQLAVAHTRVTGALASVGNLDAELSDLRARLRSDAAGLELGLENLDLDARQLPQVDRVSGKLTGEVVLPAEPTQASAVPAADGRIQTDVQALRPPPPERRAQLTFSGNVAGSGAVARVRLLGEELVAELEAGELLPATLTRLVPALAPSAPVALAAKLEGRLDNLGLEATVQQAHSRVSARGRLRRESGDTHTTVRVDASNVDLAQLLPDVPRTQIELAANANLDSNAAGSQGSYRVVSTGSRLAGEALPATTLEGDLQIPEARPLHTTGTLEIAEPGAVTHVDYSASSGPSGVSGKIFSSTRLDRSARLRERTGLDARGSLELHANLDTADEQIDADLALDLRDVRHPSGSASRVELYVSARGALPAPELQLRADARRIRGAGRSLARLWLTAQGTPDQILLRAHAVGTNPDRIELRALLAPRAPQQIQSPRLSLRTGADELRVGAASLGFAAGRLHVDRLTLDGPGHAELSLRYGRELEQLDLQTQQLDAARLLRIAGIKSPLRSARADLQAHVSSRGGHPSGRFVGDIRQFAFAELQGSLHADLGLERQQINGDARLQLTPGGTTLISLRDVRLPRGQGDLARFSGAISLQGELELSRIQSLLGFAGVERAEGQLRYDVKLDGAAHDGEPPGLRAHLESRSLLLVGQRVDVGQTTDAELARLTAPWSVRGIDLNLDAGLERGVADVKGKLVDAQGDLVTWNASWKELPERGLAISKAAFFAAPFQAEVRVPSRALEQLPAMIRPNDIEGNVALALDAEGTLADPQVRAHATLERFTPLSERERKAHLDVNLDAEYAPAGGRVALTALRSTQPVLELDSHWTGDARRLGENTAGKSPILADLELSLNEFPVGVVPLLQQHHVRGRLTGKAHVKDFGKNASVELDLRSAELKVERLLVGEVHTVVHSVQGKLELQSEINGKAGQAEARISAPFAWGDRLLPTSDGQLDGTLQTRALRLGALLPLLEGSLSELDGQLDSKFSASIRQGETQLTGHATLRDGVLQMPSVGQRFTDIDAEVSVSPGSVRLEKLTAKGLSGGFEAQAQATLAGMLPTSANASVKIKENQKLPLTLEGESLGDIWGNIEASYRHDAAAKTNTVDVKLDKVHVELPEAPPQGLQDLAQPDYIRVGYRRRDGDFAPIALQLLSEPSEPSDQKTVVVVDLGTVSLVKGQQARVDLSGKIQATLGDELDVQGRIDTKRGQLFISGKTFDIERGTVAFTGGKPDDPTIGAVARYDSPAGYSVYAEYTGTASKGKLAMRSEPALSQDEIITLLLFGTPDGSLGAGSSDSLSTAVSVAGGSAAQGLNRAIADVTDLDVSARVDTSTGAPRPELVLQLTPRVAAKVTQALGEPVPGQSPDRTFVTLDLRLANSWSLSTMVGDRGASAFDLIWRRRY